MTEPDVREVVPSPPPEESWREAASRIKGELEGYRKSWEGIADQVGGRIVGASGSFFNRFIRVYPERDILNPEGDILDKEYGQFTVIIPIDGEISELKVGDRVKVEKPRGLRATYYTDSDNETGRAIVNTYFAVWGEKVSGHWPEGPEAKFVSIGSLENSLVAGAPITRDEFLEALPKPTADVINELGRVNYLPRVR